MKNLLTSMALCAAFAAPAFANTHKEAPDMSKDKAPTAQQSKMVTCNKDAEGKTGDDRKAFMKTCLSAKKMTQQDKMKSCNADPKAKELKGDARKGFMKECLAA
jgi:psiF repeat